MSRHDTTLKFISSRQMSRGMSRHPGPGQLGRQVVAQVLRTTQSSAAKELVAIVGLFCIMDQMEDGEGLVAMATGPGSLIGHRAVGV